MTCSRSCGHYVAELGTEHPYRTELLQSITAEGRAGGCRGGWIEVKAEFFFLSYVFSSIRSQLILVAACGIQFPDQEWNPGPLHWEHGVLATGPPEKSRAVLFNSWAYEYLPGWLLLHRVKDKGSSRGGVGSWSDCARPLQAFLALTSWSRDPYSPMHSLARSVGSCPRALNGGSYVCVGGRGQCSQDS